MTDGCDLRPEVGVCVTQTQGTGLYVRDTGGTLWQGHEKGSEGCANNQ